MISLKNIQNISKNRWHEYAKSINDGQVHCLTYQMIPGQFNFESAYGCALEVLFKHHDFTKPLRIAEIGSYKGQSCVFLCEAILYKLMESGGWQNTHAEIEIHCIDTWEGDDGYTEEYDANLEMFKKNLGPWSDLVYIHKTTSLEASKEFDDDYFSFVFIDGDHSYKAVLQDIKAWYPKIKENGIIGGHDWHLPEVRTAFAKVFYRLPAIHNNSWLLSKFGEHPDMDARMPELEWRSLSRETYSPRDDGKSFAWAPYLKKLGYRGIYCDAKTYPVHFVRP